MPSSPRDRLQNALDRTLAIALGGLLLGTALGFGGAVWWAPVSIAGLAGLIVVTWVSRAMLAGSWRVLKSPLTAIGGLAVGLAAFQLAPMPPKLAAIVSPRAHAVQTLGLIPDLARSDDPAVVFPEPIGGRTALTLDRPATLRWLGGALACLGLFWVVSHYVDRLDRLYLVWGCVIAAYLLNTAITVVQLVGQAEGIYGFIEPGQGPKWAPTVADALAAPGETSMRSIPGAKPTPHSWAPARPDPSPRFGTLMGGPGAYLALGALGLPLALAVTLQLMAPRGSREGLWARLGDSGQGSLLVLLYVTTIASAFVTGVFAGPRLAIPFAAAVALVGLPSLLGTGLRVKGLAFTALVLAALGGGVVFGDQWEEILPRSGKPPRVDFAASWGVWSDALPIVKDFPMIGTGLGSFATIEPYYKTTDGSSTTARSSVLQWWVESGFVGLALIALASLWGLARLPGAIRRVGSADRALAFGMVGVVACFLAISTIHWTVELAAVALAASAVAGTCNRWLAGGTDLFVERA